MDEQDRSGVSGQVSGRKNHFVGGTTVFVVYAAVKLYHDLVGPVQIVDFDCHPFLSLAKGGAGARGQNSYHSTQYHRGTQGGPLGPVASTRDGRWF